MAVRLSNLDAVFAHHPPDEYAIKKHQAVRTAAQAFARTILEHTPPCADQTVAVRKVREAMMYANAAIALGGEV